MDNKAALDGELLIGIALIGAKIESLPTRAELMANRPRTQKMESN